METTRGVVFVALAVLMAGGVLWVPNGLAAPASIQPGVMRFDPSGEVVPGSSAMLVRTDQEVTMTIHTSCLVPGAAYTVWWIINPGEGERFLNATGHVIGHDGVCNFAAHLAEGDAREALIVLIVRSHGQPIPGMVKEQITTLDGGCSRNDCVNEQFAIFEPLP